MLPDTPAKVVAVIVLAMKTKPVLDLSDENLTTDTDLKEMQTVGGVVRILQNVLLPHLAAGLGLLLVSAYVGYLVWIKPLELTSGVSACLVSILLVVCGVFAFGYALLGDCVFALYEACTAWEDFIDRLLEKVQEKAIAKLEGLDEGLAKDQAKVLIRGSVREVFQTVRKQKLHAWPRWLAAICLGGLTLAMRSVLIARIVKWSGTTIKISKIFAGKATLVGAIFLNLRFFALLLLILVYGAGSGVLFINALLLWCVK